MEFKDRLKKLRLEKAVTLDDMTKAIILMQKPTLIRSKINIYISFNIELHRFA